MPDFWLPGIDIFIEVKGQMPSEEEILKCQELANQSKKTVGMVFSDFCSFDLEVINDEEVISHGDNYFFLPDRDNGDFLTGASFKCCEVCADIYYHWGMGRCCPKCEDLVGDTYTAKRKLNAAYAKAKQARFEHGELGGE